MYKIGFDNDKYLALQSQKIKERVQAFGDKLYIEFGGKLFDDYHASRVLPGFLPDSKLKMLSQMKDQVEIVIVISATDIENNKYRADIGITYDADVLRHIDVFRARGFYVSSIVITMFREQPSAIAFQKKLENFGFRVYRHYQIDGYPYEVSKIVSDDGYGRNEYIKTERDIVIITAPGPGSGKMATCLSQIYHDYKKGIKAGYAKFETFPVWNLPLSHPVNKAYEAATADLNDVNMIDPFHLEAYGKTAVNYNRDVEIFPVLNAMFKKILGESPYKSPTDMGVNMAGFCITDDEAVSSASRQEIIRRYYKALYESRRGRMRKETVKKLELLMQNMNLYIDERQVVKPALDKALLTNAPAVAMQLSNDFILTGKTGDLLGASSSCLINALKYLAKIDDSVELLSPTVIEPIQKLKVNHMGSINPRLHTDEVLMALSICAVNNNLAKLAIEQLPKLKGAELHSSVILSHVDEKTFKALGINVTYEPKRETEKFYF